MIVLVTGGRDFADSARVATALSGCWQRWPGMAVVQGGAKGADALARYWCASNGVPCITIAAQWERYSKRAGSIRNGWMIDLVQVAFVIAFPGGAGTADMCRQAKAKGIKVYAG